MEKKIVSNWYLCVLAFLIVLFTTSCNNYGKQKMFNGTQVFYTSAVTVSEVQKLGQYLIDTGFADGDYKTVQLNKTGNTYEFRMVVKKDIEINQEYRYLGKLLAAELSEDIFNGERVETHFCDDKLKTLIVLPMETR